MDPDRGKCYGMRMTRPVIFLIALFLAAATCVTVLDHAGAEGQPAAVPCPDGLLLDPDPGAPPAGNCLCPTSGEGVGFISTDGSYTPYAVEDRPDADGVCSTDPRPAPAEVAATAPPSTLPGEPVYPVPPAPSDHPGGPVSARPALTG